MSDAIAGEARVVAPPRFLHVVLPGCDLDGAVPLAQRVYWPCAAGQTIAIVNETEGTISRGNGRQESVAVDRLRLGVNVAWNAMADAIVAEVPGHILMRDDRIWVEEKLDLDSDVDAGGGVIDFGGPIYVRRNVMDLAQIRAGTDVTVDGAVEAAMITAGRNIVVNHGICGKEKGRVEAQGSIHARFVSNATVTARGEVVVANEVGNSHIVCGKFNSPRATILSSHVSAIDGIVCECAGSSAGIRTILEIGMRPEDVAAARQMFTQLVALQRRSHDVRAAIEPLMKNPKALTPQQKEKATELLFLADEADGKSTEMSASLNVARQQTEAAMASSVEIGSIAHPGVVVRLLGYETKIESALRGPLKIALRALAGEVNLVVLDAHNHVVSQLVTAKTELCSLYLQLRNTGH